MTTLGDLRKARLRAVAVAPTRDMTWAARLRTVLLPAAILFVVFGVLAAHAVHNIGAYVTGNDPGNWLAAGRAMWETPGDASFARPLVPLLAQLLALAVGPHDALRAVAVVSALSIPAAVFLVSRTEGLLLLAALAALVVGLARPVAEAVAFGGYPQNIALAGTVLAAWLTARMLEGPPARARWFTAALVVVALAHHIFYVLALLACGLVVAIRLLDANRDAVLVRAQGLVLPVAVSLIVFAPTAATMTYRGYEPTPGIEPMGLESALAYTFGDARPFYMTVILFGILGGATLRLRGVALQTGAALFVVAGAAFVFSSEPRLLAMLFIGAVICAAGALGVLVRTAPRVWVRGLALVAVSAGALGFAGAAFETNATVFEYYRTFDADLAETVEAVDSHPAAGAVAVAPGRDGWPIGWWFEGLGDRDVVTGSDSGWLAFPGEREQANLVADLTAETVSADAAERALAEGIALLVADTGIWTGWRTWLSEPSPAVELAFANDRYVVLRFTGKGTSE